ncbi:hypothetical protein JCM8097_006596 [Rhodosporidiobolus ruineniae]
MLLTLPPELVGKIVSLTFPPSPWPDSSNSDKVRRATLSTLSSVCSATRVWAQPLLWRKVVLHSPEQVAQLLGAVEDTPDLAQAVRTVRIYKAVGSEEVMPFLRRCSGLRKLQVNGGMGDENEGPKRVNWADLEGLPLEVFELRGGNLTVPDNPKRSNLVRLSIDYAELLPSSFQRLLRPEIFPRLQVFGIGDCYSSLTDDSYFPTTSLALTRQLDLLLLRADVLVQDPSLLYRSLSTPVLFTVDGSDWLEETFLAMRPAHLRILLPSNHEYTCKDWARFFDTQLDNLAAWIGSPAPPLSLHLPLFLRTLDNNPYPPGMLEDLSAHAYVPAHDEPLQPGVMTVGDILAMFRKVHKPYRWPEERDAFLTKCQERGVEVLWHDATVEQPTFGKELWAWARRVRQGKDAAAAAS